MIKLEGINFSYNNKPILKDINVDIKQGSIVSLLGANGAGKSTLIKIILRLLQPDKGLVQLDDKDINSYNTKQIAQKIAYVPQSSYLPFSYSVIDVVIMGRISYQGIFSKYTDKDRKIAKKALERLGMSKLENSLYNELSGGQKQLVLIARALAQEAKVFIMDEPVSGLDYGNQLRLLQNIKNLAQEGYTFLKSTHYPDHAFLVSDEVILMKEGAIIGDGRTQDVITKENIKVLYDIDVNIEKTLQGYNMCIPNFEYKV